MNPKRVEESITKKPKLERLIYLIDRIYEKNVVLSEYAVVISKDLISEFYTTAHGI